MSEVQQIQPVAQKTTVTGHLMKTVAFEEGRNLLHQLNVKCNYDDNVIIYYPVQRNKPYHTNEYVRECNGLILSRNGYKPLVVPPRTLISNINTDICNNYLHQGYYHIYKVNDGTCFNLYYFAERWFISTNKGFDMNHVKWGNKTYQEIITECLNMYSLTWESFTSMLDINRCYSMGFKHPNFHKFLGKSENQIKSLWFIQSVVTDEKSEQYLWASDKSPFEDIPNQEFYTKVVNNFTELYKISMNALNNYNKTGEICYGFILRSVDSNITNNYSDLLIESSLLKSIRKFWYSNYIIEACHKNKWEKDQTILLNAYLNIETRSMFTKLFPQYSSVYNRYTILFKELIAIMVNNTVSPSKSINLDNSINKKYDMLANKFITEFKKQLSFDLSNYEISKVYTIYYNYVCHPRFLNVFVNNLDLFAVSLI
jgi:hypothetical protein